VVAVLALVGAGLVLISTQSGVGVTADSIVYFNAAEFLLEGKGISRMAADVGFKPVTHFPPLYPLSLAALHLTGMELKAAARWLNAGLMAVMVWLAAFALQRERQTPWISILGAALLAFSPITLDIFAWAMSEPLFIVLVLLSLVYAVVYFRTHNRQALFAAGIWAAGSYLTRYSGLALIGAIGVIVVVYPGRPQKSRWKDAFLFSVGALTPVAIWLGRNIILAGSATNRQLAWHPITLTKLKRWFHMLYAWLLPFEFTHATLLLTIGVIALLLTGFLIYQIRHRFRPLRGYLKQLPENPLRLLSGWFTLVYALFTMASISLFDASTPLDIRITLPMYVTLLVYALTHLPTDPGRYLRPRRNGLALAAIVLLVGSYGYRTVALAAELSKDARGYAMHSLVPSSQIELIHQLPDDTVIYSNNLEAMYYFYHRPALIIPYNVDAVSQLERNDFDQQLEEMRQTLRDGEGVMIIFYSRNREGYPPSVLLEGLEIIQEKHDVMIYAGPGMGDTFLP
jgi:hypothetical protein